MFERTDELKEGSYAIFKKTCSLETQGSKIIVGVVYCCPSISKDEDTSLHKVITHVSRCECLIIGDFNQPDIRWDSLDSSNESAKFLLLVQNCGLKFYKIRQLSRGGNFFYASLIT